MDNTNNSANNLPPVASQPTPVQNQISGLAKAGVIVTIVGSSIAIFVGFILMLSSLVFFTTTISVNTPEIKEEISLSAGSGFAISMILYLLLLLAAPIVSLVFSAKALKKPTHTNLLVSGIFGIFFGWIVGGILTLVGNTDN